MKSIEKSIEKTVSERGFGIELEMYGAGAARVARALTAAGVPTQAEEYSHETRAHWKIVTDGSLCDSLGRALPDGLELVSPILRGADGLKQIETVCRVLKQIGVQVNHSTGFHVHHDASDLSLKNWKMLLLQYIKHEEVVSRFLPQGRRNNSYCKLLRTRFYDVAAAFKAIQAAKTMAALQEEVNGRDRYFTINMENWSLRGTVEFRQHSGTVDAAQIVSWVLLTQAMVEYSFVLRYYTAQGSDNADNLFAFRRFFTGTQKEAVQDLPTYFRNRADSLTAALTN